MLHTDWEPHLTSPMDALGPRSFKDAALHPRASAFRRLSLVPEPLWRQERLVCSEGPRGPPRQY